MRNALDHLEAMEHHEVRATVSFGVRVVLRSAQPPDRACGVAMDAARPVFITDGGAPTHVLLSSDEYQRLTCQRRNLAEALSMPGLSDIEFEPRLTSEPQGV